MMLSQICIVNKKSNRNQQTIRENLFRRILHHIEALFFNSWLKFGPGFHFRQL